MTRHIVKSLKPPHLVILSAYIQRRQGVNLPSWVPDWGICTDLPQYRFPFEEPADSYQTLQPVSTLDQSQKGQIALKGRVFTSIAARARTWKNYEKVTGSEHVCIDGPITSHLTDWLSLVRSSAPSGSQRTAKESGAVFVEMMNSQLEASDDEGELARIGGVGGGPTGRRHDQHEQHDGRPLREMAS